MNLLSFLRTCLFCYIYYLNYSPSWLAETACVKEDFKELKTRRKSNVQKPGYNSVNTRSEHDNHDGQHRLHSGWHKYIDKRRQPSETPVDGAWHSIRTGWQDRQGGKKEKGLEIKGTTTGQEPGRNRARSPGPATAVYSGATFGTNN